jgi:hypothetical protein
MDIWVPPEAAWQRIIKANPFSISDLKPEIAVLEQEHLKFAAFVFVTDKIAKAESCLPHETEYYIGHQIARFFLGDEWVNRNIFGDGVGAARQARIGRTFLKSDATGVDNNVKHQDRVIKLAECLYNLQHVECMDGVIKRLKSDNLESVYSELECARAMSHQSLNLRFIKPDGHLQDNYDAEITTPGNRSICCEIKSKNEKTALSRKAVERSIELARQQLPENRPGLVWLRIPELWSSQVGAKAIVDAAVKHRVNKSSRLVAIIVGFQLWSSEGNELVTAFRYTEEFNERSPHYNADIKEAVSLFGCHQNEKWMYLRDFTLSHYDELVRIASDAIAAQPPGQRLASPSPQDHPR